MRQRIKQLLEEAIPYVDFDGDFLFAEMDSLGVTTVLMILSEEFGIELSAADATPRNLKSLDSIVALVEAKQAENE
ncbi:MAG: phosphopantetheine-binding protein [Muribaculaceae bacterium]